MIGGSRHIAPGTSVGQNLREEWLSHLDRFDKLQLTFSNSTNQDQLTRIWGANQGIQFTNTVQTFSTDNYPQVIARNPVNNYWYVVNQLAASIEMFSPSGDLIQKVQIEQQYVGFASLVDIAFDNNSGFAFVIGAISNQMYVINDELQLETTIDVANRPVSIAFNEITEQVHIAHLTTGKVSIVNPTTEDITLVALANEAIDIAVDQSTGRFAVIDAAGDSLALYDSSNLIIGSVENIAEKLRKVVILENGKAIVTSVPNKEIVFIDLENLVIEQRLQLNGNPVDLQILQNGNIVVSISEPNQIVVFDTELNLISSIDAESSNGGTAIDTENNSLLIPDPISNSISITSIDESSQPIIASDNYLEVLRDFQHKPVLMKHLKVHFSAQPTAPFIRVGSKSSSGKVESRLISMEKYRSPQHFAPIFNLMEFENEIIDGRTFWEVLIPPQQSITLMLYYKQ